MRAVIQRVTNAKVTVNHNIIASIGAGLCVLIGVEQGDNITDVEYLSRKLPEMRIFDDTNGKLNLSLNDVNGEMLIVSQFTLLADTKKGRRPSFNRAMHPENAESLIMQLVSSLKRQKIDVKIGQFRAHMKVSLTNDGPVTIIIDSKQPKFID